MSEPLVLVHGEEPFLVERDVRRQLHGWTADLDAGGFGTEAFREPSDLDAVARSLGTPAFLDPRRVVILWDPPACRERPRRGAEPVEGAADSSAWARDAARLVAALEQRDPSTAVCLGVRWKLAERHPVLVAARRAGTVRLHPRLRARELRTHVESELRTRGLRVAPAVQARLQEVAELGLGRLDQELGKLALVQDERGRVDTQAAQALVSEDPGGAVWGLTDSLVDRPLEAPARLAALLAQSDSNVPGLIGWIAGAVRRLLSTQARLATGLTPTEASGEREGWKADQRCRQARRVPGAELQRWLEALAELDSGYRSGLIDAGEGLRLLVAAAATARASQSGVGASPVRERVTADRVTAVRAARV